MGASEPDRMQEEIERLRHALDAEVQRSADLRRRLEGSGAEFEEFVSLAVHDLRQSLRDVAAFSQLLADTCAARLDSDAGVFLRRIQVGAASMQSLLAGVVDYGAACTGGGRPSRTDMSAVLDQALLCTEKLIAERGAIVTHDPMPVVTGEFEVLAKILHHLIRNAIEYCDAPSPRVHVSATRADPDWVISVRDNGPGIEPVFHSRVFQAFKRLHGEEHPGNGLGLAFCRKAVERLGGRMWLESAPGTGSVFYFTLPPAG